MRMSHICTFLFPQDEMKSCITAISLGAANTTIFYCITPSLDHEPFPGRKEVLLFVKRQQYSDSEQKLRNLTACLLLLSQLLFLSPASLGAGYLTSLRFTCLICKMVTITVPISQSYCENKLVNVSDRIRIISSTH